MPIAEVFFQDSHEFPLKGPMMPGGLFSQLLRKVIRHILN
jgi:hypothetical protein